MKTYLPLAALFLMASCVSNAPVTSDAASTTVAPKTTTGGATGGGAAPPVVQGATADPVIRVKNYNQYNMTLEKLTNLSRAKYNTLFDSIIASLPADNDIGGLTPFNLIAMTRLADAYCVDYVERESTVSLNGLLFPVKTDQIRDALFAAFLDVGDDDAKFASLKTEVDNVLHNDDGSGGMLFPSSPNTLVGKKGLASAACVTILASPYITLLE